MLSSRSNILSLLGAFNNEHKYGIIRVSKTSLDSSADRNNLTIPGYGLIRADPPSDKKRCIVFILQGKPVTQAFG